MYWPIKYLLSSFIGTDDHNDGNNDGNYNNNDLKTKKQRFSRCALTLKKPSPSIGDDNDNDDNCDGNNSNNDNKDKET